MREPAETFFLVLTNNDGLGQIAVDLESYFDFGQALSLDLQQLAETWLGRLPSCLAALDTRIPK